MAKSWVRSRFMGGVIGVFSGGLTILLLESLGHGLFGSVDPSDLTSVTGAMWGSVLVSWIVGAWIAGALATYWAKATRASLGLVVGLILLAGAVSNMVAFPHPVWMMAGAVVLMPTAAVVAARAFSGSRGMES